MVEFDDFSREVSVGICQLISKLIILDSIHQVQSSNTNGYYMVAMEIGTLTE